MSMKNKILFTAVALMVSVPAFAYIGASDTYSSDFLKLNGYSSATIYMVNHERNKAAGIPNDTTGRKVIKNRLLRVLYNSYAYVDPACEGNTFFNHDINIEPSYNDL